MSSPTSIPPRPGSPEAKQRQRQRDAQQGAEHKGQKQAQKQGQKQGKKQGQQQTPQFKKRGAHDQRSKSPLTNPWLIAGVLGVVVAIVGVVSILSATESPVDRGEFAETRVVTSTGEALPLLPQEGADPAVGRIAPVVSGQNFEGFTVDIDHSAPTLVVFVAHWCPVCQAEVPDLVTWNRGAQVPAGVRVVGVATATDDRRENYPPSEWLVREGFPWAVLADSEEMDAAAAYGVSGYPFFAFVDADGTVLWRTSGRVPAAELTERIEASLAG